jgi:YVTN family beta-propeller protein
MNAQKLAVTVLAAVSFTVCTAQSARLPLRTVADVPLTGRATRLDYQSFDPQSGRLYVAHLGDDMLTVFDTNTRKVVGDVKDLKSVHGVLAVPELHRVYASATGTNELAVIDDQTLQVVARVLAGDYPDGIAYASREGKLYVSDKHGKTDTVIDAKTNQRVATIQSRTQSHSVRPSISSVTMFGWLRAEAARDSRAKRARACGSEAS